MQEVSKTITIDVEEYKKLLLDAHDAGRYSVELYKERAEVKALTEKVAALEKRLRDVSNT